MAGASAHWQAGGVQHRQAAAGPPGGAAYPAGPVSESRLLTPAAAGRRAAATGPEAALSRTQSDAAAADSGCQPGLSDWVSESDIAAATVTVTASLSASES